jgi:hypothetical protein
MVDMDEVVAKILRQRPILPEARSLLVGVSGIKSRDYSVTRF